jgi:hypothetical protein
VLPPEIFGYADSPDHPAPWGSGYGDIVEQNAHDHVNGKQLSFLEPIGLSVAHLTHPAQGRMAKPDAMKIHTTIAMTNYVY